MQDASPATRSHEFVRLWLDALVSGARPERPVCVTSDGPFRESLCFANRPIRIAGETFDTGLAFLTDGAVEVTSALPVARFRAVVGLDDNAVSNRMALASVVFSVEAEGRELWRSAPLSPHSPACEVDLPLEGLTALTLKATMVSESARALTGYWAHADFAGATVDLADGSTHTVARSLPDQRLDLAVVPPISFRLGDRSSDDFFRTARRTASTTDLPGGERRCTVSFRDPGSGVTCRLEARQFGDSPAVDWIAWFSNESDSPAPLLEEVRALDLFWPAPAPARLHCARGSDERPDDFQLVTEELSTIRSDLRSVRLHSGDAGRSSVDWLPFMNLETTGEGLVIGIGWSGQWSAEVGREAESGAMRLRAGMDGVSLRLQPGETIRTPRILLLPWQGQPVDGNNLLRRHLLAHCVPRLGGRPVEPPASLATWGGQPTSKHLQCLDALAGSGLKFDCYWVDAGWYGTAETPCPDVFSGEWWKVGDWRVNRGYHPEGLKPLSDAVHAAGMKLMVWVDIESALHGVPVTLEHPEWFLSRTGAPCQEGDALLLNLGHPEALAHATETISGLIEREGVDWYRQDFNHFRPLDHWHSADGPGRRGMAQIRHIEGLYAFWDELRRRHPGLLIDNCASGGRRIDLETLSRSLPLWRSDYGCFAAATAEGLQVHSAGIACWVPFSAGGYVCPPGDTYYFRSSLSAALSEARFCHEGPEMDDFIAGTSEYFGDWFRKMLADYYRARPLYSGDFYPLTGMTLQPDTWLAYQLHRPDLDEGLVLAFRRRDSPHAAAEFRLRGLSAGGRYCFEDADNGGMREVAAQVLTCPGVEVRLPEQRSCCLLFYRAVAG